MCGPWRVSLYEKVNNSCDSWDAGFTSFGLWHTNTQLKGWWGDVLIHAKRYQKGNEHSSVQKPLNEIFIPLDPEYVR